MSNPIWGAELKLKRQTVATDNKEAALMKVVGMTIHAQSSQSIMGSVRCQRTKNLDVKRVYERGIGIPRICSQTLIFQSHVIGRNAYTNRDDAYAYIRDSILPYPWYRAICVASVSVKPRLGEAEADRCWTSTHDYWG
ncbi:hypothetical protein QJS10_CPA09g01681 [Acorus calamus]|uniref:Uncharacterized protein n=1 Tax=Acorus calamus TaxID=4465 RepID=A0AAV9E7F3_ACOCL|nr:hypothetical protein QJS10_CPA09g01681 [Acorus calamus]